MGETGDNWLLLIITYQILNYASRDPRIFAVTTTTSLSTVNTQSLCYSASDAGVPLSACAARRKRMLNLRARKSSIDNDNEDANVQINPSNSEMEEDYFELGNSD